jgi:signal transduction histidine kinase
MKQPNLKIPIRASKLSIKVRLTLWFTLALAVLAILVQVFILLATGKSVVSDAGSVLVGAVEKNVDIINDSNGEFTFDQLHSTTNGVYLSLYSLDGEFLDGAYPFECKEPFSLGLVKEISQEDSVYYVYDMQAGSGTQVYWVRGIATKDAANTILDGYLSYSGFVLSLIVVIGSLGGYLLSSRLLKPIRQIREAADAISDGNDLSLRIGLGKPGSHDELCRLSDSFDNMFARLEKSFNDQQQFTSDASHELRTPTTVILAECDYTRKYAENLEDYQSAIDVISRQAKKMSRLVENLLSMTRLDLGVAKANFEVSDFSEMLEVICSESKIIGTNGISLTYSIEPGLMVNMDVSLLSRLVQNLIDNAYKYGKKNGYIHVSLKKDGDFAVLAVEDNGIGIAPENLDRIWDRFYQEDRSRSNGEGLGMGLSMVKNIARLHKATVDVSSTLGEGSCFTVRIPLFKETDEP